MKSAPTILSSCAAIAGGLVLAATHFFGESSGSTHGWYPALGFGAPFVGLGPLALLGELKRRPWLTVWSGFFLATISIVSVVLFPLLLAAGVLMGQGLQQRGLQQRQQNSGFLVPWALAAASAGMFWFLALHKDPATWATTNGTRSSSNIVTDTEATISLVVLVGVISVALKWASRPKRPDLCPNLRS